MKLKIIATACAAALLAQGAFADSYAGMKLSELQAQVNALQNQINHMSRGTATGGSSMGMMGQVGTDTMAPFAQLPATSFALDLLKEKDKFSQDKIYLGGYLEADAQAWGGGFDQNINGFRYHSGTGVYLTTAKIYTVANINSWTTAVIDLGTDFTSSDSPTIERGFVTFGNLEKAPLYLTVGKLHLSNGVYGGGGPWINALQRTAFRPGTTDQLELGYFNNGLATTFELFNSGQNGSGNANDFVMSMHYAQKKGNWQYGVGAGYLNDIRGLGSAGSAYANGTGALSGKSNALWDVNANVIYGAWGLSGEYNITSTGANRTTENTVNKSGNTGKMSAWVVAGTYTPNMWSKPTAFTISWSGTNNMAGVPMGLAGRAVTALKANNGFHREWIFAASREIAHNIYIGPEWAWASTYGNTGNTWESTIDLSVYF